MTNEKEANPNLCKVTNEKEVNPNLCEVTNRKEVDPHLCKVTNEKEADPHLCKVTNEKEADPHLFKVTNEKEANPTLCEVTNEKEADPHLWGGLLWPVGLPHHGFPRDCVLQQRTQPLALPGFGKFHLYLSWSSPPPQQIQLPAGTERTHTLHQYNTDTHLTSRIKYTPSTLHLGPASPCQGL